MPKRRRSLRTKLTLWMIAVSAIIQGTFVVLILLYERSTIGRFFDERLLGRSISIRAEVERLLPQIADADLERIAARYASEFVMLTNFAFVLYGPDGTVIASTERPPPFDQDLAPRDPLPRSPRVHSVEKDLLPSLRDAQGSVRAIDVDIERPEGEYRLLIATTDEPARRLISHLGEILVIALLAGLVGAAISAWIISGIATAPLRRVLESMKEMSPGTVSRAVEMHGGSEELAVVRRELDAMRARMEEGFKAQERFISNVSHEIKTPISVLMTEMQTLPPLEKAPPQFREFIQSVGDEMRRLGGMVESFLLLTRVRDGKPIQARVGAYQVNELLMDAIESSTAIAEQYEVLLSPTLLENDQDLDLSVRGVPDLLRTMLDNLIRNAIRFSPPHEHVYISARHEDNQVIIEIRDYGPGIPENLLLKIFDRFAQSDSEIKRGRGHGLGLEIAQGIAELHGGWITVENCADRGCRFTVRLPVGDNPSGSRVGNATADARPPE